MILDAESIQLMPEELLCVCPVSFSIIALCGQPIGFSQFGTVSKMSTPATEEHKISILNLSSFSYNYTFVPQEQCKLALSAIGVNYRVESPEDYHDHELTQAAQSEMVS